jgi:ATP-dependent helicase/nuclease subunit B
LRCRELPAERPRVRVIGSARFEDEAAAAADQLVQWLNEGRRHVALVAHDRVVARRARALLARAGAPVRDETGWKLSTTRAAAALMRWFDVLARDGDSAALLDLLKSPFCLPAFEHRGAAIALMERRIRRAVVTGGWTRLAHLFAERERAAGALVDAETMEASDAELQIRAAARTLIATLADEAAQWPRGLAQQPLHVWLGRLDAMLDTLDMRAALAADDAGRQLLDALAKLGDLPDDETGSHATLNQQEFRAMLSALLESVAYKEPSAQSQSRITILPLNGARMRRFDGVVVVGCDDAQLPSSAAELMFFSNQMRRELGLEDREARFAQQARDLAEVLLNNSDVVLTWQRFGSRGEPHHVSGWIERLSACCARAGMPIEASATPALHDTFAQPGGMPAPVAPERVPARWSAQAYNTLRRCPYQFFASRMLGLAGLDTLSDDLEKRDIGNLLHRVLLQYHEEIHASGERDSDRRLARLREISDTVVRQADCRGRQRHQLLPPLDAKSCRPTWHGRLRVRKRAGTGAVANSMPASMWRCPTACRCGWPAGSTGSTRDRMALMRCSTTRPSRPAACGARPAMPRKTASWRSTVCFAPMPWREAGWRWKV